MSHFTLNPDRLLKDELEHELLVRGCRPLKTVEQNRRLLREAYQAGVVPREIDMNIVVEFGMLREKLLELMTRVRDFNVLNRENEYASIATRLRHVLGRLDRLNPTARSFLQLQDELRERCLTLLAQLTEVYQNMTVCEEEKQKREMAAAASEDQSAEQEQQQADEGLAGELEEQLHEVRQAATEIEVVLNGSNLESVFEEEERRDTNVFDPPPSSTGMSFAQLSVPAVTSVPLAPPGLAYTVTTASNQAGGIITSTQIPPQTSQPYGWNQHVQPNFSGARNPFPRGQHHLNPPNPPQPPMGRMNPLLYQPYTHTVSSNFMPPAGQSTSQLQNPYGRYQSQPAAVPIAKWGLKFDGSGSWSAFMQRAEELCFARGTSTDQLFYAAADILEGDALHFWRANRQRYTCWNDLVQGMRMAFEPMDYSRRLWDEINRRTQHPAEGVIAFISAMENLFQRLPYPPAEDVRMGVIRSNLLPYIQFEVSRTPCFSVEELMRVCRHVEETRAIASKYKPPPTNTAQLLEPDLGFSKSRGGTRAAVSAFTGVPETSSHPGICAVETVPGEFGGRPASNLRTQVPERAQLSDRSRQSSKSNRPCWICGGVGHYAAACSQGEVRFCSRCGREGVSVLTCPDCQRKYSARGNRNPEN